MSKPETLQLIGSFIISYGKEVVRPTHLTADSVILNVQEVFTWFFFKEYTKPKFVGKNVCPKCHRLLRLIRKESRLICSCSATTYFYTNMTFASANYGSTKMNVTHHYKRVPFFESSLLPYRQGSKQVEDVDLIRILEVLNRRRQRTNRNEWKSKMITSVLQELGLFSKYKHYAPIIQRRLSSQHVEEFNKEQFAEIIARVYILNDAYLKDQKKDRINFPKFSYVINKICMQNQWWKLAAQFSLQRIPDKLKKQEAGWKRLIEWLQQNDKDSGFKWEFIPS